MTVPLAPPTARAVDLTISERLAGRILMGANGQRRDRHGAGQVVRPVAGRAGINKLVGPTLRHAFITAAQVRTRRTPTRRPKGGFARRPSKDRAYDRARAFLESHATYIVATFAAGASR